MVHSRRLALALLTLLLASCTSSQSEAPSQTQQSTASTPPASATEPGTKPASPSSAAQPTVAPTSTAATTSGSSATPSASSVTSPAASARPNKPRQLTLGIGETARLTYFDVTVQRFKFGDDNVSAAYRVQVCYVRPHAEANADGTTRVSTNPWSFRLRDGEGGPASYSSVPVSEFTRDWSWTPSYRERKLKVGQCNTGWIGVKVTNPDLQWGGIVYSPSDFGDRVTWT